MTAPTTPVPTSDPTSTPAPAQQLVPARAAGVELVGELQHSGYEDPPYLVRRADGQTLQLTELLYIVLEQIDGQRDLEGVADAVSDRIGKRASADDVRFLVEEKLRPLGVLRAPDGSEPAVEKANPLLALRWRVVVSDEGTTRRLTAPFQPLFATPVVLLVVAGFFAMVGWLLFAEGLAQGTRDLLYSPGLLVATFALTAASAGFHEFGHAAACRYGGATPGVMGAGIYLVWPAFYTDVTDSYRLSRGGRLRTDLGGLYFNMVFALATFGVWALTGWDALLVLIPLQLLQMSHQLLPFVRLDGYYILSDLTGVPDLFARIKPTLMSAVPGHEEEDRAAALKPWVRAVVTLWVLAVVPLLLVMVVFAAINLPRILATAWDSVGRQWDGLTSALGDGDVLGVVAGALGAVAVALPAISVLYMLSRLVVRVAKGAWGRTEDRPVRRTALVALGAAAVVGLAWVWWPNGEYEPIRRGERWTVQDVASQAEEVGGGRPALSTDRVAELDAADDQAEPATDPAAEAEGDGSPAPDADGDEPVDDVGTDGDTTDTTDPDVDAPTDGDEPTPTTDPTTDTTEPPSETSETTAP